MRWRSTDCLTNLEKIFCPEWRLGLWRLAAQFQLQPALGVSPVIVRSRRRDFQRRGGLLVRETREISEFYEGRFSGGSSFQLVQRRTERQDVDGWLGRRDVEVG